MNVLSKFKDLFLEVWKDGVSGINITEIIIAITIFIFNPGEEFLKLEEFNK